MPDDSISNELERTRYFRGIELFNAGEFFEAHEAWEDAWRDANGIKRSFYQGLIQCAVALEHYRRSNPRGVRSLFKSYPPKFQNIPPIFLGLDVPRFLTQMRETLRPVIEANPFPERGQITFDLKSAPTIALNCDPLQSDNPSAYQGRFSECSPHHRQPNPND